MWQGEEEVYVLKGGGKARGERPPPPPPPPDAPAPPLYLRTFCRPQLCTSLAKPLCPQNQGPFS